MILNINLNSVSIFICTGLRLAFLKDLESLEEVHTTTKTFSA